LEGEEEGGAEGEAEGDAEGDAEWEGEVDGLSEGEAEGLIEGEAEGDAEGGQEGKCTSPLPRLLRDRATTLPRSCAFWMVTAEEGARRLPSSWKSVMETLEAEQTT
jgi:hypothetical protein